MLFSIVLGLFLGFMANILEIDTIFVPIIIYGYTILLKLCDYEFRQNNKYTTYYKLKIYEKSNIFITIIIATMLRYFI